MMRFILNILILLMIGALLGGMALHMHVERTKQADVEQTRDALRTMQRQVMLEAKLGRIELSANGYPVVIDPGWFGEELPENRLLPTAHPWVEVVRHEHRHRLHPRDPIATDPSQARFWYNPFTGIVRARVPSRPSDAKTLELYNKVNETALTSLLGDHDLSFGPARSR